MELPPSCYFGRERETANSGIDGSKEWIWIVSNVVGILIKWLRIGLKGLIAVFAL